ncbi:ABC transporter permease [Streptomyces sp. VTCC 41912]|uniref:ABC transporter permease n=1 Tax=Streptomyces sp. VTCC 41912 TaxID=3383243 RepID=UPI003896912E
MKGSALSWQLLRMGQAAGKRAGGGRVRAVALLLATAVLALGLTTVVASCAAYDGIEQRTAARSPQFHDAFPTRPVTALAKPAFDEIEGRQFSLVYVRPLSPQMELPPGIDRWPAPGEALLSPKLTRLLQAEGALNRYGSAVGTIRDEGLASPGERYAYVNPTDRQLDKQSAFPIVGFGDRGMPTGDVRFIADRGKFLTALYLILLPAAVLAVVALRMGSAGRDKRAALVSALGGRWRHRALLNFGEAAGPVMAGAVLGALPALSVAVLGNVRLPWIDYWLSSSDLRQRAGTVALTGLASAAGMLLLACVVHRPAARGKSRSTRLTAGKSRALQWAALACPVLLFATVWGPAQLDPSHSADLRMKLYNTGVVAVMATLPCAVAVCAAAVGPQLSRWSRRTGDVGALVSGRHIAAHPGATARLLAGISIALVLVSQVQLKNAQFGTSAQAAQATAARVGHSVLLMSISDRLSRRQVDGVLRQLPEGVETLAVSRPSNPSSSAPARIQGPCRALRALRLTCSPQHAITPAQRMDQRLVETLRWVSPVVDQVEVQQAPVLTTRSSTAPKTLVLVSADGNDLPEKQIKQLLRDELPVSSATVDTPGAGWLVGARESVAHGRWVLFFGIPGVLIVALAVAMANLAEFLRFSRKIAPVSVLTGQRGIYYSTAAWTLLVPLLASVVTSVIAASWLAAPQERPADGVELSNNVLATTSGALAALALVTWWCGSRAAVRQASDWRPFGE